MQTMLTFLAHFQDDMQHIMDCFAASCNALGMEIFKK